MKKLIATSLIVIAVIGLIILGCSKRNTTPVAEEDTPTATITNTPEVPTATTTSTNTPTTTNTSGSPIATATNTQTGLLDDCEDGDNMNKWNGAWYTYSDESNGGGSWVWPPADTLTMSPGGYNSSYALRISGKVQAGYAYPFAGVGTQFSGTAGCPDCNKTDITTYTGVRFWIKGSLGTGLNLHVILPYTGTCGGSECSSLSAYNDFRYTITSQVTGSWTQVQIPFSSFTDQGAWGSPPANIDIVKAAAAEIQFQVKGPDGCTGCPYNFDVWIDDLELY